MSCNHKHEQLNTLRRCSRIYFPIDRVCVLCLCSSLCNKYANVDVYNVEYKALVQINMSANINLYMVAFET